jgi:hypothetical protein
MAYKYDRTQETSLNRPYFLATTLLLSSDACVQPAPTLTIHLKLQFTGGHPVAAGKLTSPVESALRDLASHTVPGYTIQVLEFKAQ